MKSTTQVPLIQLGSPVRTCGDSISTVYLRNCSLMPISGLLHRVVRYVTRRGVVTRYGNIDLSKHWPISTVLLRQASMGKLASVLVKTWADQGYSVPSWYQSYQLNYIFFSPLITWDRKQRGNCLRYIAKRVIARRVFFDVKTTLCRCTRYHHTDMVAGS